MGKGMSFAWRKSKGRVLDCFKRFQVSIKVYIWLVLLACFTYVSLIRALAFSGIELFSEYKYLISSAELVFVHIGMLAMILYDRLEQGDIMYANDYKLLVAVFAAFGLIILMYFIAPLRPYDWIFKTYSTSLCACLHVVFLGVLARLRYLIQLSALPLVKPL